MCLRTSEEAEMCLVQRSRYARDVEVETQLLGGWKLLLKLNFNFKAHIGRAPISSGNQ